MFIPFMFGFKNEKHDRGHHSTVCNAGSPVRQRLISYPEEDDRERNRSRLTGS